MTTMLHMNLIWLLFNDQSARILKCNKECIISCERQAYAKCPLSLAEIKQKIELKIMIQGKTQWIRKSNKIHVGKKT